MNSMEVGEGSKYTMQTLEPGMWVNYSSIGENGYIYGLKCILLKEEKGHHLTLAPFCTYPHQRFTRELGFLPEVSKVIRDPNGLEVVAFINYAAAFEAGGETCAVCRKGKARIPLEQIRRGILEARSPLFQNSNVFQRAFEYSVDRIQDMTNTVRVKAKERKAPKRTVKPPVIATTLIR